jgi:hypothetical protein
MKHLDPFWMSVGINAMVVGLAVVAMVIVR